MTDDFLQQLAAERRAHHLPLQLRAMTERLAHDILALLFPHFTTEARCERTDVAAEVAGIRARLSAALDAPDTAPPQGREAAVAAFLADLPRIRTALLEDAAAIHAWDPASHSVDEVILAYPGFLAIALHRVAHALHVLGVPIVPRLVAEYAHRETGIDIHPGATIGRAFAIDHGTGIVIGETTVIGDRVKLYQGVTLGALSVAKDLAQVKRHPTLENDVVVYASATILGGATVVGAGSVIGGNVWLTRSVAPGSLVTHEGQVARRREAWDGIEYHI